MLEMEAIWKEAMEPKCFQTGPENRLKTRIHGRQKCPGGRRKQQGSHRQDGGQEPNLKSRLGGVLGREKSYFREEVGMGERPEQNIKVVKVVAVKC